MKKVIIILTMAVLSLTAFTQDIESDLATDSNFEKVLDKYLEKASVGIAELTSKLSEPALQGWKILVKQQYVKAFGAVIPWLLLFFFIPFIIKSFKLGKWDDYGDIKNAWAVGQIVFPIIAGAMLIWAAIVTPVLLQGFINPEYGALEDLIGFIK